ncbi:cellulose biosynthesis protein BcsD [Acetobacter okinawensis]|uniref:cellulose biosynthesis protein BcsD n=2 Tax=Acetobacter okinawensis TaxID=1076594 RepID=UPI000472C298|nr:cellulose biosynthesis protein BcsD [Acetobacter okinawensis]MBS0987272.1 cellulose synthase [Acetobacter okinawensis]MCP1212807.1 cellulose synthase [Acetobacter okinawensis]
MKVIGMSLFLQELARSFDAQVGSGSRDRFLQDVGRQMAVRLGLPPCQTLEALEMEMNAALALLEWGRVTLRVDTLAKKLVLRHVGLPVVGSMGEPPGLWLASALAGLYSVWLEQQPDSLSDARISWSVENKADVPNVVVLTYGQ